MSLCLPDTALLRLGGHGSGWPAPREETWSRGRAAPPPPGTHGHQAGHSTDQPPGHSPPFLTRLGKHTAEPHRDPRARLVWTRPRWAPAVLPRVGRFIKPNPGFSPLIFFFFFFLGQILWCFAEIQKISNAVESSFLNADFQNLFFLAPTPRGALLVSWLAECQSCHRMRLSVCPAVAWGPRCT